MYSRINSLAFFYNDNGNLQTDAAGNTFIYDYRNRLIEMENIESSTLAEFAFDALGRRIKKIADGKTTFFYYDISHQVIAEYEQEGTSDPALSKEYVYGNGIDEILCMFTPYHAGDPEDWDAFAEFCEAWLSSENDPNTSSRYDENYDHDNNGFIDLEDFAYWASVWDMPSGQESNWYYLTDALGSVRGLVGGRFGREDDREFYNYDVYGKLSIQNPETSKSGNTILFAGYRFDPETGLYHTHYRTYDPEAGRWLQFDPIGYVDSMNLYEYVVNNPANFVDPLGLLQRRQVDYLAHQWVEGWPGVTPASREKVIAAIRIIKKKLKEMYPDADFDNSPDWKNNKDDAALQKIINESKKNPDAENCRIWNNFPGSAKTPNNCKQIAAQIKGALYRFKEFGGNLEGVNEALLASWAMRESNWDSSASAYASSAPFDKNIPENRRKKMSTAIGFLQILQSTYKYYYEKGLFPRNDELWDENIGRVWDERNLANPYRNMIAALFVLQGKPGNGLSQKLANYYGSSSAANRNYANKIMEGAAFLTEFLNGRNLYDLSPEECETLKGKLDNIVR